MLDENLETFIIYVLALKAIKKFIYLFCVAQIAILQWDKAFTKIITKYFNYIDVFSSNLIIKLLKIISIKEHIIELIDKKHLFYRKLLAQLN